MLFKIHSNALTTFIRSYHEDVIGTEDWGDGDSRHINFNAFWHCAEVVWGLDYYQVPHHRGDDYFLFKVINSDRLRQIGLAGFGEIIQ